MLRNLSVGLAAVMIVGGAGVITYRVRTADSTAPPDAPSSAAPHALSPSPPRTASAPGTAPPDALSDAPPVANAPLTNQELQALCLYEVRWRERPTGDLAAETELLATWNSLLTRTSARETFLSLAPAARADRLGLLALRRWLASDPESALPWVASSAATSSTENLEVIATLLEAPDQLAAFCDTLPSGDWRDEFLTTAGREALIVSPSLALQLAQRLPAGPAQNELLETIAHDWMNQDSAAVTTWITDLADPSLRQRLLAVSAKALALTDPDLAVTWLEASAPDSAAWATGALQIVDVWSGTDLVHAAAWVQTQPAGSFRNQAIEQVARRWLQADPPAARTWLLQQPEGPALLNRLQAEALASLQDG